MRWQGRIGARAKDENVMVEVTSAGKFGREVGGGVGRDMYGDSLAYALRVESLISVEDTLLRRERLLPSTWGVPS